MKKLNNIAIKLIASDFFLYSGWGLIAPIFAIYITEQIEGGTIEVVAFATALYWIAKSIIQPFLANIIDLLDGEKDDFKLLIMGTLAVALVPFGYVFATQVWHIFFLEFLRGVAMACIVPAWFGIFTRHISKGWEAFSWSIQSTSTGLAYGFAAAFGGVVALAFGFGAVFIFVGCLKILSAIILFLTYKDFFTKNE